VSSYPTTRQDDDHERPPAPDPNEVPTSPDAEGTSDVEEPTEAAETPAADEEAAAEEDAAAADSGGPSIGRFAALARSARFAWGVAILALLIAAVAFGWAVMQALEDARADAALERGEEIAEQVTTFRGDNIEEWVTETQALATGNYADDVDSLFNEEFRQALKENEVESEGAVESAYLQELDGDSAVVFVVARQVSTNTLRDEPVEDELRMEIELRHEGGEWLASDIAVLGPTPPASSPGVNSAPGGDADGANDEGAEEGDGE
jgi:type II secretory pathway pseudopilin PulG